MHLADKEASLDAEAEQVMCKHASCHRCRHVQGQAIHIRDDDEVGTACVQIASALSRPEEASSARAVDTPAASGEAALEAESFLSPDEALRSIHEEPEEAAPDQGALQAPLEPAEQGQSRKSSFTQIPGIVDRQNLQKGRHPCMLSYHFGMLQTFGPDNLGIMHTQTEFCSCHFRWSSCRRQKPLAMWHSSSRDLQRTFM